MDDFSSSDAESEKKTRVPETLCIAERTRLIFGLLCGMLLIQIASLTTSVATRSSEPSDTDQKVIRNISLFPISVNISFLTNSTTISTMSPTTSSTNDVTEEFRIVNTTQWGMLEFFNDFNLTNIHCGMSKCFFLSRSRMDMGYLVAKKKDSHYKMEKAWKMGNKLRDRYNVSHFMAAPPRSLRLTSKGITFLNQADREAKWKYTDDQISIQECYKFPKDSVTIGCFSGKVQKSLEGLDELLKVVVEKKKFAQEFSKSMSRVKKMAEERNCLFLDFQVLVDKEGRMYNMDLDRCWSQLMKNTPRCLRNLDTFEQTVTAEARMQQLQATISTDYPTTI